MYEKLIIDVANSDKSLLDNECESDKTVGEIWVAPLPCNLDGMCSASHSRHDGCPAN
jgi:hypothetical protein